MTPRGDERRKSQFGKRPSPDDLNYFERCARWDNKLEGWLARAEQAEAPIDIPFSDAPCGHPGQYCWTEDGGKHVVCLLCEFKKATAPPRPGPSCAVCGAAMEFKGPSCGSTPAPKEPSQTRHGVYFTEQGLSICREIVRKEMARNPEGLRAAFEALGFEVPSAAATPVEDRPGPTLEHGENCIHCTAGIDHVLHFYGDDRM